MSEIKISKCVGCKLSASYHPIELNCGHKFCLSNFRAHLCKQINQGFSMFQLKCPKDQTIIEPGKICKILGQSNFDRLSVQDQIRQNSSGKSDTYNNKVKSDGSGSSGKIQVQVEIIPVKLCPVCKTETYHNIDGILLANCLICDFNYCSNCQKAYHGVYIPCEENLTGENRNNEDCKKEDEIPTEISPSQNQNPRKSNQVNEITMMVVERRSEAQLRPHEERFYNTAMEDENRFTAQEISDTFLDERTLNTVVWPWEGCEVKMAGFPPSYESLNANCWIEDTIIEDCLKKIMELVMHNGKNLEFEILESYVFPLGLGKKNTEMFLRIIDEKQLFRKDLILSLMNTDLVGSGGHWILGLINIRDKNILILDPSTVDSDQFYQKYFFYLLHTLHISAHLNGHTFDPSQWKSNFLIDSIQQENSYDCGGMVLVNLYSLLVGQDQPSASARVKKAPQSGHLRSWIYETVIKNKNQENSTTTGIVKKDENSSPKELFEIAPFQPQGLKIEKVCQNCLPTKFSLKSLQNNDYNTEDNMEV